MTQAAWSDRGLHQNSRTWIWSSSTGTRWYILRHVPIPPQHTPRPQRDPRRVAWEELMWWVLRSCSRDHGRCHQKPQHTQEHAALIPRPSGFLQWASQHKGICSGQFCTQTRSALAQVREVNVCLLHKNVIREENADEIQCNYSRSNNFFYSKHF